MTEGQRFAAAELCKACDHLHVSQFKTCLCSTLNGCLSVRVMLQSSSCSQTSVSPGGSSCYAHCCICTRLPKHNELPGVCLQHMYSCCTCTCLYACMLQADASQLLPNCLSCLLCAVAQQENGNSPALHRPDNILLYCEFVLFVLMHQHPLNHLLPDSVQTLEIKGSSGST